MSIWAFIIPILAQLLATFLETILKNLNPPLGRMGNPVLPDLVAAKADFLNRVHWRFWLGPKRMQYASAMYDRMHSKFAVNMSSGALDVAATVQRSTDGLDKLTPADLGDGLTKFTADGSLNFKVLPNGLVQGGIASYLLNPTTGLIVYRASIQVGKWFLSKTYESHGQYVVDPSLLNPTNMSVGKVITVGSLQMKVMSLAASTALVSLTIVGQDASGTAVLTTNTPVVELQSLDATVSVLGMSLAIGIRRD